MNVHIHMHVMRLNYIDTNMQPCTHSHTQFTTCRTFAKWLQDPTRPVKLQQALTDYTPPRYVSMLVPCAHRGTFMLKPVSFPWKFRVASLACECLHTYNSHSTHAHFTCMHTSTGTVGHAHAWRRRRVHCSSHRWHIESSQQSRSASYLFTPMSSGMAHFVQV